MLLHHQKILIQAMLSYPISWSPYCLSLLVKIFHNLSPYLFWEKEKHSLSTSYYTQYRIMSHTFIPLANNYFYFLSIEPLITWMHCWIKIHTISFIYSTRNTLVIATTFSKVNQVYQYFTCFHCCPIAMFEIPWWTFYQFTII